jgi:hypothetical protein
MNCRCADRNGRRIRDADDGADMRMDKIALRRGLGRKVWETTTIWDVDPDAETPPGWLARRVRITSGTGLRLAISGAPWRPPLMMHQNASQKRWPKKWPQLVASWGHRMYIRTY